MYFFIHNISSRGGSRIFFRRGALSLALLQLSYSGFVFTVMLLDVYWMIHWSNNCWVRSQESFSLFECRVWKLFLRIIFSRRFLLIYLRLLSFKKEKVIMCFRICIFWFVFNVLASFLAYRIYSFNRRAMAFIRGVHYVIIPKKISHGSLRKGTSNFRRIEKTQIKFLKFHLQDVIFWNVTFIFSGYYKKFSIVLLQIYTVSQKFVPLISCVITFDQNFEISKRCLLLHRLLVVRSLVTGMPPFFFYHIALRHCGKEWDKPNLVPRSQIWVRD